MTCWTRRTHRERDARAGRPHHPGVQHLLRGLRGLDIVGADVVEVAPAYDHAELTTIAAANLAYELLALMAVDRPVGDPPPGC